MVRIASHQPKSAFHTLTNIRLEFLQNCITRVLSSMLLAFELLRRCSFTATPKLPSPPWSVTARAFGQDHRQECFVPSVSQEYPHISKHLQTPLKNNRKQETGERGKQMCERCSREWHWCFRVSLHVRFVTSCQARSRRRAPFVLVDACVFWRASMFRSVAIILSRGHRQIGRNF